jgi:hypothetical protein
MAKGTASGMPACSTTTHHGRQLHRHQHLAGQAGVVETVVVAQQAVGLQFQVGAAEAVALAVAEVLETHLETTAHAGVQRMHLAGEAAGRQPLGQGRRFQKSAVDLFRRTLQHTVQADGAVGHGFLQKGVAAPTRRCCWHDERAGPGSTPW